MRKTPSFNLVRILVLFVKCSLAAPVVISALLVLAEAQENSPHASFSTRSNSNSSSLLSLGSSLGFFHSCAIADNLVWCFGNNQFGQLGDGSITASNVPVQVQGLVGVIDVTAGTDHTCAIRSDETLWCFGSNDVGQLGDGTNSDRLVPVPVQSLAGVIDVFAGGSHTCALLSNRTLWCFGDNQFGQLGDGSNADSNVPVQVQGLLGDVIDAAAGSSHTCAIRSDESLWCFGRNTKGQLGDGSNADSNVPVQVQGLVGVISVAVGVDHTCAIRSDETLWCFGNNEFGQLGINSTADNSTVPTQVVGLDDVRHVSSGVSYHTCAIRSDETLWCFGYNADGQLGDGSNTDSNVPVQVQGLVGVTGVASGFLHTCAITSDERLWCFGNNDDGQLGDGTDNTRANVPQQVLPVFLFTIDGALSVTTDEPLTYPGTLTIQSTASIQVVLAPSRSNGPAISAFDCASFDGGALVVDYSSLNSPLDQSIVTLFEYDRLCVGSGTFDSVVASNGGCIDVTYGSTSLVAVVGCDGSGYDTPLFSLASTLGDKHSCVIASTSLWCVGRNFYGQLGIGSTTDSIVPVQVPTLADVLNVAAGEAHTCAVLSNGTLWCFGRNQVGQLGINSTADNSTVPVQVVGLDAVINVAAGTSHTCALLVDGNLWCFGTNLFGQLGDGSTSPTSNVPVQVVGLDDVIYVAAGTYHTCALRSDDSLWCFGGNTDGQLGIGSTPFTSNVPLQVVSLDDVIGLTAGTFHTCARRSDETMWCFGKNQYGQLGDGSFSSSNVPVQVSLDDVIDMNAGGSHTCALRSELSLWCFGFNGVGPLGINSTADSSVPVRVQIPGSIPVIDVTAGSVQTCATLIDQTLWCFGGNFWGQLGINSTTNALLPQRVAPVFLFTFDGVLNAFTDQPITVQGALSTASTASIGIYPTSSDSGPAIDVVDCVTFDGGQFAIDFIYDISFFKTNEQHVLTLMEFDQVCGVLAQPNIGVANVDCENLDPNRTGVVLEDSSLQLLIRCLDDVSSPTSQALSLGTNLGGYHSCVMASGSLWCFGRRDSGQLGLNYTAGEPTSINVPVQVPGLPDVIEDVAAGLAHTCALLVDGQLCCFGDNWYGQLGTGSYGLSFTPQCVLRGITDMSTLAAHTCAIDVSGGLFCFGSNVNGQTGQSPSFGINVPLKVLGLPLATKEVGTGVDHTCALLVNGTLWCFGSNFHGQLGDGSTTSSTVPVQVVGLDDVIRVSAGGYHTCAIRSDETLWCFGYNTDGQLGDGTYSDRLVPVPVQSLAGVIDVSAGQSHTCVLLSNRTLWCFGYNADGQLGDGSTTDSNVPVQVQGLGDVISMRVGLVHTCAIRSDGTLWCFGYNTDGQLGDGTDNTNALVPQLVSPVFLFTIDGALSVTTDEPLTYQGTLTIQSTASIQVVLAPSLGDGPAISVMECVSFGGGALVVDATNVSSLVSSEQVNVTLFQYDRLCDGSGTFDSIELLPNDDDACPIDVTYDPTALVAAIGCEGGGDGDDGQDDDVASIPSSQLIDAVTSFFLL